MQSATLVPIYQDPVFRTDLEGHAEVVSVSERHLAEARAGITTTVMCRVRFSATEANSAWEGPRWVNLDDLEMLLAGSPREGE